MLFNPRSHTTVFLSYDEPNCEENYQHLLTLCPNALRVHGVKGSDTAHKAVAFASFTENVIVVDGDNFVKPTFYDTTFELPESYDSKTNVLSFSAYNIINGNCYGNGGIKVWPVSLLESMKTHENGDEDSIDFDFSTYIQVNMIASETRVNSSPLQAWRAGFREGIKLTQDENINWRNYDRLWRWMHLGMDVDNGVYAIHGARSSFYLSRVKQWECPEGVKDFDFLNKMFELSHLTDKLALEECNRLGVSIMLMVDKDTKPVLSASDSKEYRETIPSILRCPDNNTFDIVFISYNESYADANYQRLLDRFPRAKRINGVKGIHQAHLAAAKICTTDYFWVVDADAEIVDSFNFEYNVNFYEEPKVRVWRSKNAVNDLVYGNGGVKLLPRMNVIRMPTTSVDMTTSISELYEPIFELSNINNFNSDAFSAWRSAFRECVKLSSKVIDRQVDDETNNRLDVWCTVGVDKPFGEYVIAGAQDGRKFGESHKDDRAMLGKINDYIWLEKRFRGKFH